MAEFYVFAGEHPILTVILAMTAASAVRSIFYYPAWAYNRRLRAANIAAHGWPTAPMDADGDVVYPKSVEA